MGRLELGVVDHPEASAGPDREGGDEVAGLGHGHRGDRTRRVRRTQGVRHKPLIAQGSSRLHDDVTCSSERFAMLSQGDEGRHDSGGIYAPRSATRLTIPAVRVLADHVGPIPVGRSL